MPPPNSRLSRFRRLATLTAAALTVTLLSTCTPYQISDRSVSFNDSLEDFDNRQVLLNAVRSSKNYPPYFTSVSQITSSGELDGSQINFTIPFGPIGHNAFSAAPMIKVSTGISVATLPLDTQDFYEGYMAYVKLSLMQTYFYSGWNYPLLYHAFFQEVDLPEDFIRRLAFVAAHGSDGFQGKCPDPTITEFVASAAPVNGKPNDCATRGSLKVADAALIKAQLAKNCQGLNTLNDIPGSLGEVSPSSPTVKIHNNPTSPCEFAKFQLLVAIFDAVDLRVGKQPPDPTAAPPLTIPTSNQDVSIKVQSGTATAANDDAKYGFGFDGSAAVCGTPTPAATPFLIPTPQSQPTTPPATPPPAPPSNGVKKPAMQQASRPARPACPAVGSTLQIVTRSPEGIVYYLGQLVEADLHPREPGWWPKLNTGYGVPPALFMVKEGAAGGQAVVSVALDGNDYYIPREEDYNNSMHFLTLVEQLIALQKKGTQLPVIPTVQLLNQ
jgi:hypothetical protein